MPFDLRVTSDNPVFGQSAAQDYQNKYFDMAARPMIDGSAMDVFRRGMGDSTFGGSAVSNTALEGAKQAFFAGQDFRNSEINNTLNRRNNLFGNDVQLAANQNALGINRALGLEGIRTQRLNDVNSFNLGNSQLGSQFNLSSAGLMSDMDNQAQNRQLFGDTARATNVGNFLTGGVGLGAGLLNAYMRRKPQVFQLATPKSSGF
jgi:hypothetical protein